MSDQIAAAGNRPMHAASIGSNVYANELKHVTNVLAQHVEEAVRELP